MRRILGTFRRNFGKLISYLHIALTDRLIKRQNELPTLNGKSFLVDLKFVNKDYL